MKNLSPSDCSSLEMLKATLSDFLQKIPKNPCTGTVDMAFKILCFFFWLQKSQQLCEIETTTFLKVLHSVGVFTNFKIPVFLKN